MTVYPGVVVPAIAPVGPRVSLLTSAIRPDDTADPALHNADQIDPSQLAALPQDLRDELAARRGEAWTRGFTYAPENHWTAQVRDPCDFATVDEPALHAPTGLALTQGTGGTLSDATYSYQVTAVNANGQTTALAAVTLAVSGGSGSASVKLTWDPTADGVTYKVYGRIGGAIGLIATVGPFNQDNPPHYSDLGSVSPGAAPPGANTTAGPGTYTNLAINVVVPYLVVTEDSCSTWGFEERDFKGRALRLLENAAAQAIERELWTGALATAAGWPNRFLTDSNLADLTPAGGPCSAARGQQILQDYLAQTGFGGQGMIHCQPQTAPNLLNARRLGQQLLDIFDNVIVPGVGYTGLASGIGTPAAGTAVMIATDLVAVRAESEGTVFPDTFAEAIDWGQGGEPNTLRFRAEKFAAAYFDGAVQAGVRVSLAV